MKIRIIGCCGGFPNHGIGTSCYLLTVDNYHLLIDCGSGDLLTLEKYLNPIKLNAVVLSHYHADHIADVGVLQYYWQLHPQNRTVPILPIFGNTEDPLHYENLNWANSTKAMAYSTLKPLKIGPLIIHFQRTVHPVPAYAMRITNINSNKTIVYTADSNYDPKLINFAKHADLLLTDTNYFADHNKIEPRWHMTSTECGLLAKQADCQRLLLTHLPPKGDLDQLQHEAQLAADKKVNVHIAKKGHVITI